MVAADDFSSAPAAPAPNAGMDRGIKRNWCKAFETPPPQLLNAYGRAKYATMKDAEVWQHARQPLKTGADSMTEYASLLAERRGIGANRWPKSLLDYLEYQLCDEGVARNKFIMKTEVYTLFYDEIKRMMPHVRVCLAPKKVSIPQGASSLRSSASSSSIASTPPTPDNDLNASALALYEWVDPTKQSRIRMMLNYQGGGGLPYVASVHQLMTQCFLVYGNTGHEDQAAGGRVSVTEFQEAVRERHRIGHSGISAGTTEDAANDFLA